MPLAVIYIASGMLLLGIMPWPYGYYMLLRLVACGVFSWAAYISLKRSGDVLPWVFIVLAIVFNPIIKIHFPKEIWVVIDFCSGILLILIRGKIQEDVKKNT
jgi:hypothetical protein